jgi:hypothetical protein
MLRFDFARDASYAQRERIFKPDRSACFRNRLVRAPAEKIVNAPVLDQAEAQTLVQALRRIVGLHMQRDFARRRPRLVHQFMQ